MPELMDEKSMEGKPSALHQLYSPDGSPIFVEVKNSVKNNIANFHLTAHEFDAQPRQLTPGYLI